MFALRGFIQANIQFQMTSSQVDSNDQLKSKLFNTCIVRIYTHGEKLVASRI